MIAKKDSKASYSISLKYYEAHANKGKKVIASEIPDIDMSKGIFVFSKEGCGRCQAVEKYLNESSISFTKLNITKNTQYASLMWQ